MTRGVNLKLPVDVVLARAKSIISTGKYTLVPGKNGGHDPTAKTPYGDTGKADCIGAVMWMTGLDRYQPKDFLPSDKWNVRKHGKRPTEDHGAIYNGYINTNSILLPNVLFREIPPDQVLPGDILAWPSYMVKDGVTTRKHYGHALLVYTVYGTQNAETVNFTHRTLVPTRDNIIDRCTFVHCSSRAAPATGLSKTKIPKQVTNEWRFLRPVWR